MPAANGLIRVVAKGVFAALAAAGVRTDPLSGDPTAHRFRSELRKGRWEEFHEFLKNQRDWDSRHFYVVQLSNIEGRPGWLEEWVAARPGSSIPLLFRGSHGVHWAWEARGETYASMVPRGAWKIFHERLIAADRDLSLAASLDEDDPTPYARGITIAMGLGLGNNEKTRRFNEAARRQRWHVSAHMNMIQALAGKWSGSDNAMLTFARKQSADAPEGHSVHKVIASAHIERRLSLDRQPNGGGHAGSYFWDREVRKEIYQAADRSIRSADYAPGVHEAADRNFFAMAFWLMRDYDAQLEQMNAIGARVLPVPWKYHGPPGWAYKRARSAAAKAVKEMR